MKEICFFSGDIARSGGTERVATVIASELVKCGYEVSILSVSNGERAFFPLHPDVQLHSLHMEGRSANFSDLAIIKKLHNYLKRNNIDIIVDVDVILSWYSLPASIGTSAEVVSWENFHFFINEGGFFQRLRRTWARKLASRFSRCIVTLTDKDKRQYLDNLSCLTKVVAINNPHTIENEKKASLDSNIVLAAGRLTNMKGFDLLLKSWSLIAGGYPDWSLRIVGSGECEEMLKALAHDLRLDDSVEFIPKTNNIEKYYLGASIYALSSRFEGFGLVLLEAKSFGLPIVSFDCDYGPADIVRDGLDGILVPKEDVQALADGIMKLIHDPAQRSEFGNNAVSDRRFDVANIITAWRAILT